jgi:hypothetical protein
VLLVFIILSSFFPSSKYKYNATVQASVDYSISYLIYTNACSSSIIISLTQFLGLVTLLSAKLHKRKHPSLLVVQLWQPYSFHHLIMILVVFFVVLFSCRFSYCCYYYYYYCYNYFYHRWHYLDNYCPCCDTLPMLKIWTMYIQ